MIRVALADDHTLFRKSLRILINSFDDCEVVLEAENGLDLEKKIKKANVDVLLLDIQMPQQNGIVTCTRIHEMYPEIKILILTQIESKEMVLKMIENGAAGYFTKNTNPENLEKAIKNLTNEGFYFDQNLGSVIRQALNNAETTKLVGDKYIVDFTDREIDIIRLIAQQKTNHEIGEELQISPRTIETYRKKMIEKTGCKNIIGVVIYAVKHDIIVVSDQEEDVM